MKAVDSVVHVATWDPDPSIAIPQTVLGMISSLKSASKSPSVKRFAYTSSSSTTGFTITGVQFHCDGSDWGEKAAELGHHLRMTLVME